MSNTRILDPVNLRSLERKLNHTFTEQEKSEIFVYGNTKIPGAGFVSCDDLNFPSDLINRVNVREVIPPGYGTPYED